MVRDLEARLKNERVELGHRGLFDYGRRGEVPPPTRAQQGYILSTDGWVSGSGGGGGLSTVEVDNLTIGGDGSSSSPLSASLLSGTINARFINLSGSITGKFNSLSYLSAVSHDSTLSGDGTAGNPLSASPTFVAAQTAITASINGLSGTINSAIVAILSSSQAWSQTAAGSEGTTLSAVLPTPFTSANYHAFITNYEGAQNPAFKIQNKTSTGFEVVSSAPFTAGDKVDFLAISGTFAAVDGSAIASLSGTINARFVDLSGSIDSAIRNSVGASSITIERVGDAQSVNMSTSGTVDWMVIHTTAVQFRTATSNRFHKMGGGFMYNSWNADTGGQTTTTTLMNTTTRSADAVDSMEQAAVSQTNCWGIQTSVANSLFGHSWQAPSSDSERVMRVLCGNGLSVARLTCWLDNGTTASLDYDSPSGFTTHELKVTFRGGSMLFATWMEITRYGGTRTLAFAGATLGV